jgi:hypothetical protein
MKKKTHPGEALMWFSVALIVVGIILSVGSYIGDLSVAKMGLLIAIVGVVVAVLAKIIMK